MTEAWNVVAFPSWSAAGEAMKEEIASAGGAVTVKLHPAPEELVSPLLSVIVTVGFTVPAERYTWVGVWPVPVDPSPKAHA